VPRKSSDPERVKELSGGIDAALWPLLSSRRILPLVGAEKDRSMGMHKSDTAVGLIDPQNDRVA
jgi:hypothetical protein